MFDDPFDSMVAITIGFFITVPFAVWKWVELIICFVKWFSSHWN